MKNNSRFNKKSKKIKPIFNKKTKLLMRKISWCTFRMKKNWGKFKIIIYYLIIKISYLAKFKLNK